jgi:hypothetical protein
LKETERELKVVEAGDTGLSVVKALVVASDRSVVEVKISPSGIKVAKHRWSINALRRLWMLCPSSEVAEHEFEAAEIDLSVVASHTPG